MFRHRPIFVGLAFALLVGSLGVAQRSAVPLSQEDAPLAADLAFVEPAGRVAWLPAGDRTIRLLGRSSARYAFPLFSPDGSQLAAIERSEGSARAVVWQLDDRDGTDPAAGTRRERSIWFERAGTSVIYLDWQDDGRALRVLSGTPQGLSLYLASSDEVVGPWVDGAPIYWDEGPNGLVVHVGGPGRPRLVRLADDGEVVEEIGDPGAFRSPAVSASGRWLAFGERRPGNVRRTVIVRQPRDGASEGVDRRSLDVRGLSAFAWHPARDLLALTRPFEDTPFSFGPLGGLDATSGLFEAWVDVPVVAFWWSPDGRTIGLLALPAPAGGRVAGARPGAATSETTLASTTPSSVVGPNRTPRRRPLQSRPLQSRPVQSRPVQSRPVQLRLGLFSPDRGDVAWLGTVTPQSSFLDRSVPFFDQYARSHAVWSPDGRWLALPVLDAEGRDVVGLVDVRNGRLRSLGPGTAPVFAPPVFAPPVFAPPVFAPR